MTPRQRFIESLTFGRPDRIPFTPGGPMEAAFDDWQREGFPPGKGFRDGLLEALGIDPEPEPPQPRIDLGVSFDMIPRFEERIIESRDGHNIVQDWMGAIVEIPDQFDAAYHTSARDYVSRRWLKSPVESRADWERLRQRYDPRSPGRFPDDFEDRCARLADRDDVLSIGFNGPFWQLRDWLGFEGLCTLMLDDPSFVQEMCDFWTDFISDTLAPICRHVQLDCVTISEDMAFKLHSMISPEMARRFLLPAYRRWSEQLRASGCRVIMMDCDGYVADLIPIWIDGGITCAWPIEVAAENDILDYRRRFGNRMAYQGGMDKRAIARGGDTMRDMVMRIVPPLLETGGFIPRCDHAVPTGVSWPNYLEYARLLAQLTGWL